MFSNLELREIRVFLTLAQELHYGHAAERLAITPSRVSQIIRTLETRVGGRLFDRTSRHVRLTSAGEQLLASVAPIYQDLERAFENARQNATGIADTLRIGIYTRGNVDRHMVQIVHTFTTRHPGADVTFIETDPERSYIDHLRDGSLDMLVARLPLTDPDITVGPVLSCEQRVLLVSTDDPLAQRQSVSVEDLANRPVSDVMGLPREMMDTFIPPVTPSGRRLRRIGNRNLEEVVMRVALGEQVHLTVATILDFINHPGVTTVPIADMPPSQTALVWLTASSSPTMRAFTHAAADVLAHTDLSTHQTTPSPQ
jgi:DNA-binding transcriptional LysR family regulator